MTRWPRLRPRWLRLGALPLTWLLLAGCGSAATSSASTSESGTPSPLQRSLDSQKPAGSALGNLEVATPSVGVVTVVDTTAATSGLDGRALFTAEAVNTVAVISALGADFQHRTLIHVQLDAYLTNAQGKSRAEPVAWIEVSPTALRHTNLATLRDEVESHPADIFELAGAYSIEPLVWGALGSDAGTLTGPSSGRQQVHPASG